MHPSDARRLGVDSGAPHPGDLAARRADGLRARHRGGAGGRHLRAVREAGRLGGELPDQLRLRSRRPRSPSTRCAPCASSACGADDDSDPAPGPNVAGHASTGPRGRPPEEESLMGKSDIEIAREVKLQPIQAIAETLGLTEGDLELYGRYKAKVAGDRRAAARAPRRRAGAGDGHDADAGGRGQVHHHGGAGRRLPAARQALDRGHARAVAGAVLRREGRGGRRRLRPGRAHGGHQPPLHGRLARGHGRPQPAGRHARQPPLPGQRARPRRAPARRSGSACST